MSERLRLEIRQNRPFATAEQEAFVEIQKTADVLMADVEALFREHDLSPTQYNVLRILRGAGDDGLPCGEIARRMINRDPDMTRLLDRLEKREWIIRQRSTEDRRVVTARITLAGVKVLEPLDRPVLDMHHRQLGHLSKTKLAQLCELLAEVRGKCGPGDESCK